MVASLGEAVFDPVTDLKVVSRYPGLKKPRLVRKKEVGHPLALPAREGLYTKARFRFVNVQYGWHVFL